MKTNLYLFLALLLLLFAGCGKDEPAVDPEPDGPDTPTTENTSTYVPIDWEKTQITKMDMKTGDVTLTFTDKAPEFENGLSLIVLETDTSTYIRRVMNTDVSNKTATLQTVEANMTELFADTEFTLSLAPSAERAPTKSGTASIDANGILHPVRIIEINENNSYRTLYDIHKEIPQTRAEGETGLNISFPEIDNSGKVISASEDGNLALYWDTYKQNFSLNATAHFKFGKAVNEKKITEDLKIKVSELEEFRFTIGAKAQWDMILGASAKGKFKYEENDITIAKGMFKPRVFTFFTPTGIPVIITLGSDLLGDFSADGDAKIEIKGGVNFSGSLTTGIEYKEKKWQPIGEPTFEYQIHPLEITAFANLNMKISAYPKIKIKLYNFLGPAFSPQPFLKDSVKMGMFNEMGSISKNYYGWTEKTYAGVDLQTSIMLDFIGINEELPFPPITFEGLFYNAPDKIELKSPENGLDIQLDKPIEVTFNVTRKLLAADLPIQGVSVKFESPKGKVSQNFLLTDLQGNAKVQWTPTVPNDSLTAKIFNASGEVISQATFKPKEEEEEFSIVGRWWEYSTFMLPENHFNQQRVDSENYLEFFSDGTFVECSNPFKKTWGLSGKDIYGIGTFYTIRKGTYTYFDSILKTTTTYYYTMNDFNIYDSSGNFIRHDFRESHENGDELGGKVKFTDINTMAIYRTSVYDPDETWLWFEYGRITKDFKPELLNVSN